MAKVRVRKANTDSPKIKVPCSKNCTKSSASHVISTGKIGEGKVAIKSMGEGTVNSAGRKAVSCCITPVSI